VSNSRHNEYRTLTSSRFTGDGYHERGDKNNAREEGPSTALVGVSPGEQVRVRD
jgi:hypothetical protein